MEKRVNDTSDMGHCPMMHVELQQLENLKNEYIAAADAYVKLKRQYDQIICSDTYRMGAPFRRAGSFVREKITSHNAGRLLYKTVDVIRQKGVGEAWGMFINKLHVLRFGEAQPIAGCSECHLSEEPSLDVWNGTIAVHVHLYYTDLVEEFCTYLDRIPYPFDLYLSVKNGEDLHGIERRMQKIRNVRKVTAEFAMNRGRDLAPFYAQFGSQISEYQYCLHIHTKKSLYTGAEQSEWRHYCMDCVLGSEEKIKKIFYQMENCGIGLFFPDVFYSLDPVVNTWMSNLGIPEKLSEELGIPTEEDFFSYPVGSFFWGKTDALRPLFERKLTCQDFDTEKGQIDGTLAHTLERIIGPVAESRGYHLGIYDCFTDELCYDQSLRIYQAYFSKNVEQLISRFEDCDIVSFSAFDSLLTRRVFHPETLYRLMEGRILREWGSSLNFSELRLKAQNIAESYKKDFCTLRDIYDVLRNLTGLPEKKIGNLLQMEISLEKEMIIPRREMQAVFSALEEKGKKILIHCNTSLPRKSVEEILQNCGYSGWDRLCVSSEIGISLNDKSAWTLIEAWYGGKKIVHCGTDPRADVVLPDLCGIETEFLMTPAMELKISPFYDNLKQFMRKSVQDEVLLGVLINEFLFNGPLVQRKDARPDCRELIRYGALCREDLEDREQSDSLGIVENEIYRYCEEFLKACGFPFEADPLLKKYTHGILQKIM